ncbi:MAG: class I SAM-dependent methyltransferase [Micropepsaceae bacterium]
MSEASATIERQTYNDRLFSKGLRARLHLARFYCVQQIAKAIPHDGVLELGCFDGRLLDYIKPARYVGLDAGWEGGIDNAIIRHGGDPSKTFIKTEDASELSRFPARSFDLGVALETLEHMPDDSLEAYLEQMQRTCKRFLVTVPNEKGPVFLGKWMAKRLLLRETSSDRYTFGEVVNATLGRMDRVARREHKGFDYAGLARQLSRRFVIEKTVGLPWGPPYLAFSVGFLMTSR